jgi:tetratricopeptide (TPR) repeat protein
METYHKSMAGLERRRTGINLQFMLEMRNLEYDQAMVQFQKCAEMFPGFAIDHQRMARLYAFQGKFENAISEDARARSLSGEDQKSVLQKEAALRRAWNMDAAQGYWKKLLELKQLPDNPPEYYESSFGAAILFSQLGRKSAALDALEKAYEQRSLAMTELSIEPAFDPLRADPRFQSLLLRAGLAR